MVSFHMLCPQMRSHESHKLENMHHASFYGHHCHSSDVSFFCDCSGKSSNLKRTSRY